MIGHELGWASRELDKLPKIQYWIIAFGKGIFARSVKSAKEVPVRCSTATQSNDSHFTFDHFIDQVGISFFHLREVYHRIVQVIGGANLDRHGLWTIKNLGDGVNRLEDETAPILDTSAVTVCSFIGTTDEIVKTCDDEKTFKWDQILRAEELLR